MTDPRGGYVRAPPRLRPPGQGPRALSRDRGAAHRPQRGDLVRTGACDRASLRIERRADAWGRSLFGTVGLLLLYYVLSHPGINVGDVAVLSATSPVFVALVAPLRYAQDVAAQEAKLVSALPKMIELIRGAARAGDTSAARYVVDRVLGRVQIAEDYVAPRADAIHTTEHMLVVCAVHHP